MNEYRWVRWTPIGDFLAGPEVISFCTNRKDVVLVPRERLEELLFEAGYNPAEQESV